MTGTPSADLRTSNSRPSQAGMARAASNAAIEFSGAWRQSPRWARRSVRAGTPLPDLELRGDPQVVARIDRGVLGVRPVEGEPRRGRADGAAHPDVVEALRLAVGVHPGRRQARWPRDGGFVAVGFRERRAEAPGAQAGRTRLGGIGVEVAH